MSDYITNRDWSDRMLPQVKQIVGPLLLEAASLELDTKQATDLIVLCARDMRIAARVRRPGYWEKWPYEITIRSELDSGIETELSKIIDGWGDWFFYGHSDEHQWIARWWLVDLSAFRSALIRARTKLGRHDKSNGDGTHFVAFDLRTFPKQPPILVDSSQPLFMAAA